MGWKETEDVHLKVTKACIEDPWFQNNPSWYYRFHGHAKQYGIYVHSYFDFWKLSGDPKGFTCGDYTDSTLYDVPRLLELRLREWDSTIHAALQDIFSTPGTTEYKIIQNKNGKGYKVLFDIILPDHPEHDTYPLLIIKDRPIQQKNQSITDYVNEYVNYLRLSAYLRDVSINLNNDCECKIFIGNLWQGQEFLDKMYDERHSNDLTKRAMYKQGNLIGTLESVAKRICPSCHISNNHGLSPVPKKELIFNCLQHSLEESLCHDHLKVVQQRKFKLLTSSTLKIHLCCNPWRIWKSFWSYCGSICKCYYFSNRIWYV